MQLIDFILNLAGLLLWLNWRSLKLDPLAGATPATLVGTIRRTSPTRPRRWHFLLFLAVLILIRAFLYERLAPALNWTPKLDLGAVVLAFRSDQFQQQLLFSVLSLLRMWVVFQFWLFLLAAVNRNSPADTIQKLVGAQLGRAAQWPSWIQLIVPLILAGVLWLGFHPLLIHSGNLGPAREPIHVAGQCLVIGLGLILSLKYLLPFFFLLHLVSSYVYFGANPFWDFVANTSRNLLGAILRIRLRWGRVDLTPFAGLVLVILLFYYPVPGLLRALLDKQNLTLWPG